MGYVLYFAILIAGVLGWGMNIYKFVNDCDFASPYKCELVRGVGTVVPPIGAIIGYMDIEEGKEK